MPRRNWATVSIQKQGLNFIGDAGAQALAEILLQTKEDGGGLRELYLDDNKIRLAGVRALAEEADQSALLDAGGTEIEEEA